ncbi:unknown [Clostridium sp. CAG:762]|nr:unknown [Clostridium sp. CAG:762]
MIDKMLLINFNVIHIIHYKYINGVIFDEIYSLYFLISYVKLIKKIKKY